MEHLTTTPFGRRPVTAGLLARAAANRQAAQIPSLDKWSLFRDLSTARQVYGLNDRALLVLNALLSFHPRKTLDADQGLIVFPSNASLMERAHGIAESTLRRHLATLVDLGLIARHDSPNGKRYARRAAGGEVTRAFGFDLRPLLLRAPEIIRAADDSRAAASALRICRERIQLLRRDAVKCVAYAMEAALPGEWSTHAEALARLQGRLRRKLPLGDLQQIEAQLVDMLADISRDLTPETREMTQEMSATDSENERHYQSSDKDSSESEPGEEEVSSTESPVPTAITATPLRLPLALVLEACPDIRPYSDGPVQSWHDLIRTASSLRGMMGIDPKAWEEAQIQMGPESAAVTLACILQRFSAIRTPGAYLRSLTAKSRAGQFSPAPMVMALLPAQNRMVA